MAIALNHGNVNSARSSSATSTHVRRVPSASVWEPAMREPRVNHVRTLEASARTLQRTTVEHSLASRESRPRETAGQWESVRSNLALGAVFGAAAILGTLFAGISAPDEPASPTTSISSQPVAGDVQAR